MTKSLLIMKSPIKADFQWQKAYAELKYLIIESQSMIFGRQQILEDSEQFLRRFAMCTYSESCGTQPSLKILPSCDDIFKDTK